jgi:hypothetical protein
MNNKPTETHSPQTAHEAASSEPAPPRFSRRRLLKYAGLTGCVLTAGAGVDGLLIEPKWFQKTTPTITLPNIPAAWEGLRIAVIGDVHVGRLMSLDEAREIVDLANATSPDLTVLLGDYVSRADAITHSLVEVFRNIRAPLGVFAVLGNHDYWTNAPKVLQLFDAAGVRFLTNEHAIIHRDGQPLCIAGVDDLMAGRPDLATALANVEPNVPRLLLCHNPDYLDRMPRDLRVDLALCAHTHGGQVRLPLLGPPILPVNNRAYAEGLVRAPSCPAYVTRGLGMVSIPVRFNCRPELPLITLRSGQGRA